MRIPIALNIVLFFISGCSVSEVAKLNSKVPHPAKPKDAVNPLLKGHIRLHDPSGIVEDQGYLMTSASGREIRMSYLPPGDHQWVAGKGVFQADEKPAWIEDYVPDNKGFWAPHAPFPRVLYYSMADDSDGKDIACIGRATALGEPPDQVWIDDGKPVLVCDRDVDTEPFAIDPAIFEGEGNTLWMVYGSHWSGIWLRGAGHCFSKAKGGSSARDTLGFTHTSIRADKHATFSPITFTMVKMTVGLN